jgi:hypothetical protein
MIMHDQEDNPLGSRWWLLVEFTVYPSYWTRDHNVPVMLLPSGPCGHYVYHGYDD